MTSSTLFALLLATIVGISIVAQGSVNAQLLRHTNLWLLLTIGNVINLVSSLIGFVLTKGHATLIEQLSQVSPRVLIPSVSGLLITSCMPIAIGRLGVATAVTTVIAVQIIASFAWEQFSGSGSLSPVRLAGAALVFAGTLLVVRGG
jgi:uncharacterized membrane protein YdcZ (DUF606 family)